MKIIVITGSTRGIGYGLADSFLELGCAVAISGRTQEAVDQAVESLASRHERDRILAQRKTGAFIKWITPAKVLGRFLMAPFKKRDLFADQG